MKIVSVDSLLVETIDRDPKVAPYCTEKTLKVNVKHHFLSLGSSQLTILRQWKRRRKHLSQTQTPHFPSVPAISAASPVERFGCRCKRQFKKTTMCHWRRSDFLLSRVPASNGTFSETPLKVHTKVNVWRDKSFAPFLTTSQKLR